MKKISDCRGGAKTVAIVGGSGFIGSHLVRELQRLGGYRIKLLSRYLDESSSTDLEVIKGDLYDLDSLRNFLEYDCTVINLVYLWDAGEVGNLQATANLLEVCKAVKVKRLIHCSTAEVVGRVSGDMIDENVSCHPVTEYGLTKLKVEQQIIKAGHGFFDVAVLRPTAVFGSGGKNLLKLTRDIVAGNGLKNYLKSCLFGRRRMNLVPVANVIAAIIFLYKYDKNLNGQVFIVSNDGDVANNFAYVEGVLMRAFQTDGYLMPRVPLPLSVLKFLLASIGRNNVNPRCNYISNKLKSLGFESPVTFEAALAEYVAWYLSSHKS